MCSGEITIDPLNYFAIEYSKTATFYSSCINWIIFWFLEFTLHKVEVFHTMLGNWAKILREKQKSEIFLFPLFKSSLSKKE